VKRSQLSFIVLLSLLLVCGAIVADPSSRTAADSNEIATTGTDSAVRARPARSTRGSYRSVTGRGQKYAETKDVPVESNYFGDPNAVRARLKEFPGIEGQVDSLTKGSQRAMHEWSRQPAEDNLILAKAVQIQVMQELALIQKLAKEEDSKKTLAAVEALMLERTLRYGKMIDRMEKRRRRMRRSGRGARGGRRGRYGDDQYNADLRGQRGGRYQNGYDKRQSGGRYDDRRGYRGTSRSDYRQDDYYEEERPVRRR